jgi:serine protease Do
MTSDQREPSEGLLDAVQAAVERVAARCGPAVVGIDRRTGRGSGIVVGPREILTLAANLRDPAGEVGIVPAGGGPSLAGRVLGTDAALDLALIAAPTGEVEPLAWAPRAPALGQAVIALANPGGQGLRATLGFVAATGRSYRGPRGRVVEEALEHTAALPRGSAGGPLLDVDGRVLGLNAVRVPGGLILSLPGRAVAERVRVLRAGEPGGTPALGVAVVSAAVARRLRRSVGLPDRDGVLVHAVAAGSPAEGALIREGDLIVAAGSTPVDGVDALYAALDRAAPDGTIELRLVRGSDELAVAVSLGAGP